MKDTELYYIGIHGHSFRNGKPARIINVQSYLPKNRDKKVPCFFIEYADGVTDYSPISDYENYKIVTGDDVRVTYLAR